MDLLNTILVGVTSSLIASFTFALMLFLIKPRIDISPYIAKNTDVYGDLVYDIKVANKGYRDVIDISAELLVVTKENVKNGQINTTKKIPMVYERIFRIKSRGGRRFPVNENLEAIWENDDISFLLFRILVKDSFTGVGKVFEQTFHTKKEIHSGKHEHGIAGLNVS